MSDHKVIPIRIDSEMHRMLRKISFLTEITMAELMRQGIQIKINEYKKVLTNADVNV